MIAEDALDQYLIRYAERKTQNQLVRALGPRKRESEP